MKSKILKSIFLWLFFVIACEDNPFFGEDTIPERFISGKVLLDKSNFHDGIFIWLEGTDIKSRTDNEGNFTLNLPAGSSPNSGGIGDGIYSLYFFIGNYALNKVEIEFVNGKVVPDIQIISSKGVLYNDVTLSRLFELETIVSKKEDIDENTGDRYPFLLFDIYLKPDVANIFIYSKRIVKRDTTIHTGLLLLNSQSNEMIKIIDINEAKIMRGGIIRPSDHWEIKFPLNSNFLAIGEYKIIPFIVVDHKNLPNGIMKAIGSNIDYFNESYKFYPFKRTGGKLVIQ
ncbi:MAG: hypothetical protein HN915_03045 [Candidatus Marinimicrobia bacterium]|jgi:hypothetical protein|nr:hypothetical protein [Candidatus Neomarinimicrobiota bacterium]MBT3676867.1 hypothetical protein [Candidatus Neomarinimicrobiota bacterium]MBT3763677.1 hypothetical protein [Candidatus Neomarinimicrobiota bacterium]MBT4068439.1 hypothetical protein [Candidatus Neomarinimicrobiota bacterium]MBT4271216.1 hypothetical protein [Candidatus Neomarinimicrobiota bacterium]